MKSTFHFEESELLPLSGVQHLAFCARQCALMLIEGIWAENRLTAEGRLLHQHAHEADVLVRGDTRIARSVRLRSLRLGLSGVADVVEFHKVAPGLSDPAACALCGVGGIWVPFPVEYKHGKPKVDDCDRVQVCAQALCLEEMLCVHIKRAALYYGKPRRRHEVYLDRTLRDRTEQLAKALHGFVRAGITPPAQVGPHCSNCSLLERCMPDLMQGRAQAQEFIARIINEAVGGAL